MNTPTFAIGQSVHYYNAYYGNYTIHSINEKDGANVYILANSSHDRLTDELPESAIMSKTEGHLVQFYDLALRAHSGTSFSPEKRAFSYIRDYEQQLTEDLADLQAKGIEGEALESYIAKYKSLFSSWMSAKTGCISTMIAGGSNFPVRRAEKANRSEERHYSIFNEWRARAKKAIIRRTEPVKTVSSELERTRQNLAGREKAQEQMKRINNAHAKHAKNPAKFDFTDFTDSERTLIAGYVPQYSWEPHPYPPYALTNNNAQIKRLKDRVTELEGKEAKIEAAPQRTAVKGEGWELIENHEADRYQFIFDSKPDEATRTMLKSHGYKWAPSQNAWQRQITANARYSTNQLLHQLKAA